MVQRIAASGSQISGPVNVRLSMQKHAPLYSSCRIRRDLSAIAAQQLHGGTPTFDLALMCYLHCGASTLQMGSVRLCLHIDRGGHSKGYKLMGSKKVRRYQATCPPRICHASVKQSYTCSSVRTLHRDTFRIQKTCYINRIIPHSRPV